MATPQLAYSADSLPNTIFKSPERSTVTNYERELTAFRPMEIQLREALAREEILLHQRDKLIQQQQVLSKVFAWPEDTANRVARLTARQREILELILAGHPSKNIAADLGINIRTVENHRASIMKKTGTKSLAALIRFALAAACSRVDA
jgi:DNA-binding CsgD family transcriptional regulator